MSVPIVYYQPIPKVIQLNGSVRKQYAFVGHYGVSLAYVDDGDVDKVLAIMGGCNCGGQSKKPVFHRATPGEISIWTTGHY